MGRQLAGVAFDLDNTLGWFLLTNPLAYLWSPDQLLNPEQARVNTPTFLSPLLLRKLEKARSVFARLLLARDDLLFTILRPNLDVLLAPLVRAWRRGHIHSIIIYSNTPTSYSVDLAVTLIERYYKAPGLFSFVADHWSPLRLADHPPNPRNLPYMEPYKTLSTLQILFQAAGAPHPIPVDRIAFVDDRTPRHKLNAFVSEGLTYIQPTAYAPKRVSKTMCREVLKLAMEALDSQGLLKDPEYLYSPFCFRNIPYNWTKVHTLHGFPDLWKYVETAILEDIAGISSKGAWDDDTMPLGREVAAFLEKIQPRGGQAHKSK